MAVGIRRRLKVRAIEEAVLVGQADNHSRKGPAGAIANASRERRVGLRHDDVHLPRFAGTRSQPGSRSDPPLDDRHELVLGLRPQPRELEAPIRIRADRSLLEGSAEKLPREDDTRPRNRLTGRVPDHPRDLDGRIGMEPEHDVPRLLFPLDEHLPAEALLGTDGREARGEPDSPVELEAPVKPRALMSARVNDECRKWTSLGIDDRPCGGERGLRGRTEPWLEPDDALEQLSGAQAGPEAPVFLRPVDPGRAPLRQDLEVTRRDGAPEAPVLVGGHATGDALRAEEDLHSSERLPRGGIARHAFDPGASVEYNDAVENGLLQLDLLGGRLLIIERGRDEELVSASGHRIEAERAVAPRDALFVEWQWTTESHRHLSVVEPVEPHFRAGDRLPLNVLHFS